MKALLLALIFLWLGKAESDCLDIPFVGKACVDITTEDCFNLNVGASFKPSSGPPLNLPPQRIPIGSLLQTAQLLKQLGQKLQYCQKLTDNCNACVEVTELKINPTEGKLHICSKPAINCSAIPLPPFPQGPRCYDIAGCQIFACPNNCSQHGECGTFGCKCADGYAGIDCSLSTKDNCLINGNRPDDKVCWTPQNPIACKEEIVFDVTAPWIKTPRAVSLSLKDHKQIASGPAPTLLPCVAGGNPNPRLALFNNCTLCVDLKQFNFTTKAGVNGGVVTGCPVVKLNCLDRDIRADQLACGEIARSPFFAEKCATGPSDPPSTTVPTPTPTSPPPRAPAAPRPIEPEPEDDSKYPASTMYVAAVVVGVFIFAIAGGGYFAWMHYKDKQSAGRVEENELSVSMSVSSNSDEDGFLKNDQNLNINDSESLSD